MLKVLCLYPQIYHKKPTKISFSGQRLYTLSLLKTLPDGTKEKIPAFFSELKDIEDLQLLENIEKLAIESVDNITKVLPKSINEMLEDDGSVLEVYQQASKRLLLLFFLPNDRSRQA
mgnify:CR=1 FL=1